MKGKINRDLFYVSILTLLTVLTWIAFDVYQALTQYTLPKVLQEQMRPLTPKINQAKIKKLEERMSIPEEELEKMVVVPVKQATQEGEPVEIESTQSATLSGGEKQ